jgi:hypothetical protein
MQPCVIDDVGGFTRRISVEELVQRHDRHRGRSKSANQLPNSTTEINHSLSFAHNTQSKNSLSSHKLANCNDFRGSFLD